MCASDAVESVDASGAQDPWTLLVNNANCPQDNGLKRFYEMMPIWVCFTTWTAKKLEVKKQNKKNNTELNAIGGCGGKHSSLFQTASHHSNKWSTGVHLCARVDIDTHTRGGGGCHPEQAGCRAEAQASSDGWSGRTQVCGIEEPSGWSAATTNMSHSALKERKTALYSRLPQNPCDARACECSSNRIWSKAPTERSAWV